MIEIGTQLEYYNDMGDYFKVEVVDHVEDHPSKDYKVKVLEGSAWDVGNKWNFTREHLENDYTVVNSFESDKNKLKI